MWWLSAICLGATIGRKGLNEKVIYGQDDRKDICELANDDIWANISRNAIAAIIEEGTLGPASPEGSHTPRLQSYFPLGNRRNLCQNQKFRSHPTAAICSATLIAPDRVLTAGHCVSSANCARRKFVFDYVLDGPECTMPEITADDIYSCVRFARMETNHLDYAVIHLDRPVVGRTPVPVLVAEQPLEASQPVIVIGFGSGIPAKVDTGGFVIDPRPGVLDYFVASTDTFAGNSGSGTFDADGNLVGILVRGQTDYISTGQCRIVNTVSCSDTNCSKLAEAEEITYAFRAIAGASIDCHTNAECGVGRSCLRSCPAESSECTGWCV